MRVGHKVVFKEAYWTGLPDQRTRTVYTVERVLAEVGAPARAARVSLRYKDGNVQHGVVADRLEPAGSFPFIVRA